jgi:hypothetical protein
MIINSRIELMKPKHQGKLEVSEGGIIVGYKKRDYSEAERIYKELICKRFKSDVINNLGEWVK